MQDGSSAAPRWMDPRVPPRFAAARGGFSQPGAGPLMHPNARGPRAGAGGGGGAGGHAGHAGHAGAADPVRPREANGKPARRRPEAEMFSITCDACGARAEVPFKPAEGREVYCPSCYRARRPST